MSGTACRIIIQGNKTQANARSLATDLIVESMTPEQTTEAISLNTDLAIDLAAMANVKIQFKGNGEAELLASSRFAIAAAGTVCDIGYEFFDPSKQQQATDRMARFNADTDALLTAIVGNA